MIGHLASPPPYWCCGNSTEGTKGFKKSLGALVFLSSQPTLKSFEFFVQVGDLGLQYPNTVPEDKKPPTRKQYCARIRTGRVNQKEDCTCGEQGAPQNHKPRLHSLPAPDTMPSAATVKPLTPLVSWWPPSRARRNRGGKNTPALGSRTT
mgnify:CR=1 FL=1